MFLTKIFSHWWLSMAINMSPELANINISHRRPSFLVKIESLVYLIRVDILLDFFVDKWSNEELWIICDRRCFTGHCFSVSWCGFCSFYSEKSRFSLIFGGFFFIFTESEVELMKRKWILFCTFSGKTAFVVVQYVELPWNVTIFARYHRSFKRIQEKS